MTSGVILMVNEQIETEHKGHKKYVTGDVTVSVTSKSKICFRGRSDVGTRLLQ